LKRLNIRKRKISKEVDKESTKKDEFIIAIFLYQTLKQYSYREVLQKPKYLDFKTPSLNNYHYRIKQLKKIKDKIQCYIADVTDFTYGGIYSLKWRIGIEIKQIKSNIILEVIIAVDNKGKALILGCETGKAYASEIQMRKKIVIKLYHCQPPLKVFYLI
jgi:hypothetical protein